MPRLLLLIGLVFAVITAPATADPTPVSPDQKAIRAAGFDPADIGFALVNLDDGRAVAENAADSLFIPASVAKLATVFPAETLLGADFRFETRLWRAGETLYLQGGGDPVLTNIELRDLAKSLKAAPLAGTWKRFVFDAGAVAARPEVDDGQPDEAVYNAGFGALNVDFNRVQVNWSHDGEGKLRFQPRAIADGLNVPADWIGVLPAVSPSPPGANFLYAGDAGGEKWLYALGLPETLPEEGAILLPVKSAALNTAEVFRRIAGDLGVKLPAPQAGTVPPDATLIAMVESPPLSEIMTGLLKYSNNMTAELIGMAASHRLTGQVLDPPASAAALSQWLENRLSYVDWHGFRLVNHSGLSTKNRASPRQIAAVLTAIARDPALAAMPSKIMGDDPGAEAVAKTGTMDFACGLAGLFTAKSGRRFAFAIFAIDRDRRTKLDASFDGRILAPTPGAAGWLGRARALEAALLKDWRQRF
ncbi:MAG TPA: D-alanyl-D-alanine carboxypeptidase [Candidatus Binatia bacterium]|nr:D-alanyl-D-alanine carboxypeptidase [Candidatus Binatia bacterium]